MKKFSTAILSAAFAYGGAAFLASGALAASKCEFQANAPDSHMVVRGDTLWGISGKFLKSPWCWPQVWDMNKEDIRNPHWIYPGQTVYFDRATGRLRLGSPTSANSGREMSNGTVRLSPQVRMESLKSAAIPSIPAGQIEPFLSQPLIIDEQGLKDAPRIVSTQEGRVMLGTNDKAYVRGDLKNASTFQVFRPGVPLKDPATKQVIAHEAAYLGTLRLDRSAKAPDEAHVMTVTSFKQEMGVGDRLLVMPPMPFMNYVPHAPEKPVAGQIVSVYGGVSQAGQNQIVSVNRGKKDGIDLGSVLQLNRAGKMIVDRTANKEQVRLPDEKYGSLFIFRVFENISYGLVMQVTDAVQVGDIAKSPD